MNKWITSDNFGELGRRLLDYKSMKGLSVCAAHFLLVTYSSGKLTQSVCRGGGNIRHPFPCDDFCHQSIPGSNFLVLESSLLMQCFLHRRVKIRTWKVQVEEGAVVRSSCVMLFATSVQHSWGSSMLLMGHDFETAWTSPGSLPPCFLLFLAIPSCMIHIEQLLFNNWFVQVRKIMSI